MLEVIVLRRGGRHALIRESYITTTATSRTRSIKNEFVHIFESRGTLKSFSSFLGVKNITELNLEQRVVT